MAADPVQNAPQNAPDPNTQDQQDDIELMQALGQEVRAYVDERLAAFEPDASVLPVVNVAPATAAVEVNVPQQAAPVVNVTVPEQAPPVVNVETAAPIINVSPANNPITIQQGSTIEVQAAAPVVNVAPAAVTIDQESVASAINESANAGGDLMRALIKSIDANTAAIKAQTEVISAPKSLVMRDGKPVGMKVGN